MVTRTKKKRKRRKKEESIVDIHICLHVLTVEAVRDPVTENVLLSISPLVAKEDICDYLNGKINKNNNNNKTTVLWTCTFAYTCMLSVETVRSS